MRIKFIEEHRNQFATERLCKVMDVSARGLRAFRNRLASLRQRSDLVTLAQIKEQSRLSLGSYGRPRMTEELKRERSGCGPPPGRSPLLGTLLRNTLPGSDQSGADLAEVMGNAAAGRDGNLRIHQRVLQSAPPSLSNGLEKPGRIRTKGSLNKHLGRHKSRTGPV